MRSGSWMAFSAAVILERTFPFTATECARCEEWELGGIAMARRLFAVLGCTCFLVLGGGPALGAEGESSFIRGDVDETGELSITDAVRIIYYLFGRGIRPVVLDCEDAADANDDGAVNLTDAVMILNALFRGGPKPPEPYPFCSGDPTEDGIGCSANDFCAPGFFGVDLEFDSIVFLVDRSGTMYYQSRLEIARREVLRALRQLPEGSQFGIVFFDTMVRSFPESGSPSPVSPEAVGEALLFVKSAGFGPGTCAERGLKAALDMAKRSSGRRKVVAFLSDGGGSCQGADEGTYLSETLRTVAEYNQGEVQIHAFGIATPGSGIGENFLKELAAANGGTYTAVRP